MISNGLHSVMSSMNLSLFLLFGFLHLSELHGQLRHFFIVRPPLTTAIWAARANVWRTTNRASFDITHFFSSKSGQSTSDSLQMRQLQQSSPTAPKVPSCSDSKYRQSIQRSSILSAFPVLLRAAPLICLPPVVRHFYPIDTRLVTRPYFDTV